MQQNNFIRRSKSLAPLLSFLFISIALFFTSRLVYSFIYWERITLEPQFWKLFIVGLRIDLILICYYTSLPLLAFLIVPKYWILKSHYFWVSYFTFFIGLTSMMEMSTFAFIEQYDLRPDRIFIEYLDHIKEVSGTLIGNNPYSLFFTILFTIIISVLAWHFFSKMIKTYESSSLKEGLILLPILGGLVFLGGRSSLSPRPANVSTAYFSHSSKMANELSLNSTFSVFCAYLKMKDEKDPSRKYGKMSKEEVIERVEKSGSVKWNKGLNAKIPFFHKQEPSTKTNKPYNIVVFIQESLGAEYVGCLGGLPLTPNLDKLSQEGMLLTNLYATGTRTVRGIEATISGFLPTPGRSVVKLGKSRSLFFTVAELLKQKGYSTNFVYGGMSNFDDMKSFFKGNGFTHIYDQPSFKTPVFEGTWGVSDEDLAVKANEVFKEKGDKPFFALMLSTSNHAPFEFPKGRIKLYDKEEQGTVHNAMKYADYAIGKFFELAKKESYYENTIFLVVADHNTRVYGDDLVPVSKFHIPGLIIGPNIKARSCARLCSQIDLMPSLLSMAGIESHHPMIGTDLSKQNEETNGRSIMQFSNKHAYRVGDTVVVHQPNKAAQCFLYKNKRLKAIEDQPELIKDALAHALLPWYLYSNRLYTLPVKESKNKNIVELK
ncbi:LTA synthase family protein [Ancylomarina sp. DW003]|nr:LTA synthase family protein [Ancylomarina sp. DW003]MDE5424367.1 LTA synthase family protein [Ancylomarina sp. DW003]